MTHTHTHSVCVCVCFILHLFAFGIFSLKRHINQLSCICLFDNAGCYCMSDPGLGLG